MKTFKLIITALLITGTLAVQVKAQEYGINGLLMGAGSGALVGQAIGRDTEATLIGTAVGGMLGYMVGNEMDKNGYLGTPGSVQHVYYPPPPPQVLYPVFKQPHGYRDRDRYWHGRHGKICREYVVVEGHHGHYREVVKIVCRDIHLKKYNRHHSWRHDYRHHWRGDRGGRHRW